MSSSTTINPDDPSPPPQTHTQPDIQTPTHEKYLRLALGKAQDSRTHGNHPFGSILVDKKVDKIICEGENTVMTEGDCTGHAEINLVRKASKLFSVEKLRECVLYTSAEPCPMCAGSIYWSGIGHVVYALPETELLKIAGPPTFSLPCREVFVRGSLPVKVEGPFLVEEAKKVHEGFWDGKAHVNGPPPPLKVV
jgi:tRNA(Arg) A34 adenosine deaminase TadA